MDIKKDRQVWITNIDNDMIQKTKIKYIKGTKIGTIQYIAIIKRSHVFI